jgi:phage tail-like protein
MPEFKAGSDRHDPYKNFKFVVKVIEIGGDSSAARKVAGVSKVSGLKRKTDVVTHREGGDASSSRKSPGRTEYEPITLERGVTHDIEFEQWANKVWNYTIPNPSSEDRQEVSLKDFRRDLLIVLHNEAGQPVLQYKVYRCWVSEFQALPDLDANANGVAIQTIKLENEGWERDYTFPVPDEPSFAVPPS